ncbi:MAG: glycerate kinase [Dehalococcoidia bacterium]
MRIVIAPQELKGSLTAVEATAAMATGVARALAATGRTAEVDRIPVADGGPGTVAALVAATAGKLRHATARDPLGRPVRAAFGLLPDGTAVVEMAAAAGLTLLRPEERDPLRAGTEGVGDLIRAAIDGGAQRIIVGLGGSATNDGGAGMARALGVRLLDADGADLPPGGLALTHLARIDVADLDPRLRDIAVVGATDVRNPLCADRKAPAPCTAPEGRDAGGRGAARRGAAPVRRRGHARSRPQCLDTPGAGRRAGWAPLAFLGATLRSGFDLVAEVTRLEERLAGAARSPSPVRAAWTVQSIYGKTTVGVARLARAQAVPCVALCGGLGDGWEAQRWRRG